MTKFAIKSIAIAVGAVCSGVAFAGSISAPVSPTTYAVEAMTATTPVTLPDVVYTMGVGRPVGNSFTINIMPSAGTTFNAVCALPTYSGAANPADIRISQKRVGSTECSYSVEVLGAVNMAVGDTFTFSGLALASHPLASTSASVAISIALKDPGETAYIDNVGTLTKTVAKSVQAVNVYAPTTDTCTVTNVNDPLGPLFGFVQDCDYQYQADAEITLDNNSQGAVKPDGVTLFDFTATNGKATIVLTATSLSALSTAAGEGLCVDLDWDGNTCEAGEKMTTSGNVGTLANIPSTAFPPAGNSSSAWVSFDADQTHSLGTSRSFSLSGTVTPGTGVGVPNANVPESFTKGWWQTTNLNTDFWVWSANAIQLMSPYFSTDPASQVFTRFFFQNVGSTPVTYTATCQTETGVTGTPGTAAAGVLIAGMTTVNARDVCSFSSGIRGAVVFTINAPASAIKGTYNIAINGLSTTFLPLTRPYRRATEY
jgi:hypothetical protein